MRFVKDSEINSGELKNLAYVYDEQGFYCGVSRRQSHPDPKRAAAGELLMPAHSTAVRPLFKEGFRPRWNGHAWDLVAIESMGAVKTQNFDEVLESKKQDLLRDVSKNVFDVAYVEVMKLLQERIEGWREEVLNAGDEMERTVKILHSELLSNSVAELVIERDKAYQFLSQRVFELEKIKSDVVSEKELIVKMRSEVETLRADVLLIIAGSQRSFWERIKAFFGIGESVELPPPQEESQKADSP